MNTEKAKKYLRLARFQADLFSHDPNTKVAAILLDPNSLQILSTGNIKIRLCYPFLYK